MNFKHWLNETEDYTGPHQAPSKIEGAPLYDLTINGIFPKDIYTLPSNEAAKHYGHNRPDANEAISIIQFAKNRPNRPIKIYRAVPDINKNINKKIKSLQNTIVFFNKHNFPPMNSEFRDQWDEVQNKGWVERKEIFSQFLRQELEKLNKQKLPAIKINSGDWITITKSYAKYHAETDLLNGHKIVTKTVPARHIFNSDGDIFEYGYDPS